LDLFITDLDKTLLRSDLTVSQFTRKVWNSFKLPLSIATARSLKGSLQLLQGLRLDWPMILLDGAMVATREEIIQIQGIDPELAQTIIEEVDRTWETLPLIVGLQGGQERFLYPERLNHHQRMLLAKYRNDSRLLGLKRLTPLPHNLKIVYLGDEAPMRSLETFIRQKFPVETKLSQDPYQPSWFLTILHPKADKAYGLEILQELTDIPIQRTTVFGDSHNDLGMFQKSGQAIAVANALPEVKAAANIVLPRTNDQDAIAHYLATL